MFEDVSTTPATVATKIGSAVASATIILDAIAGVGSSSTYLYSSKRNTLSEDAADDGVAV